jgi:hypothetical protein
MRDRASVLAATRGSCHKLSLRSNVGPGPAGCFCPRCQRRRSMAQLLERIAMVGLPIPRRTNHRLSLRSNVGPDRLDVLPAVPTKARYGTTPGMDRNGQGSNPSADRSQITLSPYRGAQTDWTFLSEGQPKEQCGTSGGMGRPGNPHKVSMPNNSESDSPGVSLCKLSGVKLCTLFGVLFEYGPTGGTHGRGPKARP